MRLEKKTAFNEDPSDDGMMTVYAYLLYLFTIQGFKGNVKDILGSKLDSFHYKSSVSNSIIKVTYLPIPAEEIPKHY